MNKEELENAIREAEYRKHQHVAAMVSSLRRKVCGKVNQ